VWNLLVVPADADENLVYQITKIMALVTRRPAPCGPFSLLSA
jgi:hypothetical protein